MGMVIYCVIVILMNIEILFETHNITWGSIIIFIGSVGSFFIVYAVESRLEVIPSLYRTFYYFWSTS